MSDGDILDANDSPLLRDRGEEIPSVALPTPDLSEVKAIYFDLDDTLCGYWDASKMGLRLTFEAHRPDGFTVEEMVGLWAQAFRPFASSIKDSEWYDIYLTTGEPTRTEQMRRTLALASVEDEELAKRMADAYHELRDRHMRLFPDAIEVLDALKGRYPLGLITNGPADTQRQEIATLGIADYFSNIYIEGEMREGKPKPSVFARAASAVGCEPHELLMVGNSFAHDIAAALSCGWHGVWIRRTSDIPPSGTKLEEMPEGAPLPDAIIQNLSELLGLL